MDIRIDQASDFRELAALNEYVQSWHHQHFPEDFKPFNLDAVESALEGLLQDESWFGYIARHNDKPIGYLLAYIRKRPESAFQYEKTVLNIDQIVVIPDYRSSGVGNSLMKAAYCLAKEKNIKEAQLDHWLGNSLAERFFARHGFQYFNHKMKKRL